MTKKFKWPVDLARIVCVQCDPIVRKPRGCYLGLLTGLAL